MVELVLSSSLSNQQSYTIEVLGLRTTDGTVFSDETVVLYGATSVQFETTMMGLQQVPLVVTGASGTGTFTLTANGLQYDMTIRNLSGSTITGSHFHRGGTGVNGPVLEAFTITNNRATGTWTSLTADERNDILAGNVYVNVHTNAHPDGEIRGQIED